MKELMKNLEELPTKSMKKSVIRKAMKKALEPTAELYKSAIPVSTGVLRDSVQVTSALKRSQKMDGVRVGRDEAVMYVGATANYAHLLEFGTAERQHKKPGVAPIGDEFRVVQSTGRVQARPYLRQAWEQTKAGIMKIFAAEMKIELEKAAKNLAAKAGKGTLTAGQRRGLLR
jgi:HK97 gp10 family phage protein